MASENCSPFSNSFFDDFVDNLLLDASSEIKTVVNLEEAVSDKSSGPWSKRGVWPLAIREEQSRIIQPPNPRNR